MNFTKWVQKAGLRRLLWAAGALALVWGLAWAALPGILKSQLESRAGAALGRKVSVGAVDFKPWTLELTLSDLRIATADGAADQLNIRKIYLDAEMQSVLRAAPVLDALTIDDPQLHLRHLGGGRYDIDDIVARLTPPADAPPSAPLRFSLYNLMLNGGSVDFADQLGTKVRLHTVRKLAVALPFLSNLESQRDVNVQPRLAFELNGSAFDSTAQATPFALSRKGEATLNITHLDLAPYLPYLPAGLPVQLKGAVLDTALTLNFANGAAAAGGQAAPGAQLAPGAGATQAVKPRLSVAGAVKLSNIRLADPQGGELLSVASVQAVLTEALPLEQRIALESLDINAPRLHAMRDASGKLNLNLAGGAPTHVSAAASTQSAAQAPAPRASAPHAGAPPAATAAPGWHVELAHLNLHDGNVAWNDDAVPGGARLTLGGARVQASNIRWPLVATATSASIPAGGAASKLQLEASASLTGNKAPSSTDKKEAVKSAAAKPARLHLQAEGGAPSGTATLTVSDLGLPLLAPYINAYLVPRAEGVLCAQAQARWKDGAVSVSVARLALEKLALTPPADAASRITARELPSAGQLEVLDSKVDLAAKTVSLGKVSLRKAVVRVQRDEDGQWNFARWLKPPAANKGPANPTPAKPEAVPAKDAQAATAAIAATAATAATAPDWTVLIADLAVDDSTVVMVDRVPAKRVFMELSAIQVQAAGLALDGKKPVPLTVSAKLRSGQGDPGTLKFNGSVMWAPLAVQGAVDVTQIPLHLAAPYFADHFNIELQRAEANFKGQVGFTQLPNGPLVRVQGDASVDDMVAKSTAPVTEELLNWKLLAVPGVDLTMVPGTPLRLKVREAALSDFFARLIINAEGRLVLQDLVKPQGTGAAAASPDPASPAATAPAGDAGAAVTSSPFIEIGPISVLNGRVAFSDRFIKPSYSADLTELNGKLSRFSSQSPDGSVQMADLELRGRAEGTAALEVVGQVNPLAKPLALDVRGKVSNLELSPLSSYAIKYAGYGIERGKLSVDVNYRILPDGQLTATNKITLNQLTFGDKVGDVTSLPVKLVVALLADRDGVIDLDLPISGSLNDPQFRIWPVVWKMIGNLFVKALTSPFSLFSGGGAAGTDTLSVVAFDAGTATISASALSGLDQVAKTLLDKPSLHLTITGTASLEQERDAIARDRLDAMVLLEKRRMAGEAGQAIASITAVSEAEYPAVLKEVYRRSDVKKPRNVVGLRKDLPVPEMEALLLTNMLVNEDSVRELARRRSLVVRDYFTTKKLPSSQLFLGAEQVVAADAAWKPHVQLDLSNH